MFISILFHKWKVNKISTARENEREETQPQYEEIMFKANDAYKMY